MLVSLFVSRLIRCGVSLVKRKREKTFAPVDNLVDIRQAEVGPQVIQLCVPVPASHCQSLARKRDESTKIVILVYMCLPSKKGR